LLTALKIKTHDTFPRRQIVSWKSSKENQVLTDICNPTAGGFLAKPNENALFQKLQIYASAD
jgi:hypothetical protein